MLYLKKIEMYGFKSFADKVEMRFDHPITGIVGPNGCGKSNVSDAIRWVLGEQSTKKLRGKAMQDLIFNGTDSRKSMSYCEVSLFLDNTTRIFPIQLDEIIISRKLYRNNESEYSLNRNVVRLRDIQEMLRSVGLGKEGYSIVGQGRMDAVLNARPEERRAIFEEALGISNFINKRNETNNHLDKTRVQMEHLLAVMEEVKIRIPELKRQSTNARKYLDIYNELKLNEINAYIYGYDHASQDKEDGKKRLDGLKEQYAYKESQYAEVNERYDELFHKRNGIDGEIQRLHEQQVALAVEMQKQEGDKNLIQEKINNCQRDIANNEVLISDAQKEIEQLQNANDALETQIARRKQELTSEENEELAAAQKFNELCRKAENVAASAENARAKLDGIHQSVADCKNAVAACEAEKVALANRVSQIEISEQEISQRLNKSAGKEGELVERYKRARENAEKLAETVAQLKKDIKQTEYRQFQLAGELQRKQQAYSGEKGSIDMLRDVADNYKRYQASVQYLMQDARRNKELSSRICGVVANLVHVQPQLQLAIEVALGGRLQNVVTENEQDVKYIIQYLKDHDYGRVTFLPVASMKPHGIDRADVLKEKGVLGVAADLVQYDRHYDSVFQSILGGIVVVDTFDNAVAISKKYRYAHRMVTLTGERISNDGSLEGGSKRSTGSGLLSYETEIAAHTRKLEELSRQLAEAEDQKATVDKLLAGQRQTLAAAEEKINLLNVEIATAKEKIETSGVLNNSDKQSILGLSTEKEKISARVAELDALVQKNNTRLQELATSEANAINNLQHLKSTLEKENAAKEAMQSALSNKRYRIVMLKANVESAQKEQQNNLNQIAVFESNVQSRKRYCEQVKHAIDALYDAFNESAADTASKQQMTELLQKIKSADTLKEQLERDFNRAADERLALSGELEGLRGTIDKEEYILGTIDDNLLELQQRVQDEYGITYSAAMEYKKEDFDNEAAKTRISELKVSLQRLGGVNVHAIQELEETQKRYDDYAAQYNDVKKAEEDLKTSLKVLTNDIETRFNEGMARINDNFRQVFRELFNGGNARLYVEHDETKEPLRQGVEIEAQPPGKKLQNISLLSGGERTMTAAAILFAILKSNPMPFCVLDEIEAALDDANSARIANYLRKFSESTQFVVITHKKPTMEKSDVLYGVTMEEKGVSKIVSVKLTEAIRDAM